MSIAIKVPSLGESVSEAMIARWVVADGDIVKADEILVELETDKAMMEIMAETGGKVSISTPEGEVVEVGAEIGAIDPDAAGETQSAPKESTQPEAAKDAPAASQPAKSGSATGDAGRDGPAASKLLREQDLDRSEVAASGKDGRVTKGDVLGHASTPATAGQESASSKPSSDPAPVAEQERKPMSMLRRKIAERLLESQHSTASLTTFNEIDMSAVMAMRSTYKEDFEARHGVRLGFMSFFSRAVVLALEQVPAINAFIDGTDIVYNSGMHLGMAVGTPRGLVVPVIRNAQDMSFAELEAEVARLGKKGKDGKISPDDLIGGTFTLSNGGVYGSLLSTPILNPPQSGILGMHKIEKRAVVVNDEIVIRPMMYVALTYDHRIVDGKEAVTFLVKVKEAMEDPARMLLKV